MSASDVAAVARVLRDEETLRLCVAVSTVQRRPALLALVVHISEHDLEEAALLLLHQTNTSVVIVSAAPVQSTFVFAVEQLATTDERASTPISVSFKADGGAIDVEIIAERLDDLRDLFSETRRLHQIAQDHDFRPSTSHSWLAAYRVPAQALTAGPMSPTLSSAQARLVSTSKQSAAESLRSNLPTESTASALAVPTIRDDWVVRQIANRVRDFTTTSQLRLFVATYNIAETSPSEALADWLADAKDADLVVIGLQEVDMRPQALLSGRPNVEKEMAWSRAISSALRQAGASTSIRIASHQHGTVASYVYARDSLAHDCRVAVSTLSTGLGGMASKGAIGMRLRCRDSVFTFVNCHLAAFEAQVERRNQDLEDITRKLSFPAHADLEPLVPLLQSASPSTSPSNVGISQSNVLFVFGDLNYRLELPASVVKSHVAASRWSALRDADQLHQQQRRRRALVDFHEGELAFAPTYKYDIGSVSGYDSSEKQRTPSWTDRILWLDNREETVTLRSYGACQSLVASDHKPVSAVFDVQCLTVDAAKRLGVRSAVLKELDAFENEAMPNVEVEPSNAVDFGIVEYAEPVSRTFTLRNTGHVVAEYRFVPKPGTETIARDWLTLSPTSGLILPGATETLTATLLILGEAAGDCNFTNEDISDIVILSIIGGRDIFLSLGAREYLPTCFGNSFERLRALGDRPIRGYTAAERCRLLVREDKADAPAVDPPKELLRLTDLLSASALGQDDLFLLPGDPALVARVRQALDTGDAFPSAPASETTGPRAGDLSDGAQLVHATDTPASPVAAVADCLLHFLDSLPSLVPPGLYDAALGAGDAASTDGAYRVAAALPALHAVVFTHCLAFLKTLLDRRDESEQEALADRLAVVFSSVLVRPPPGRRRDGQGEVRKRKAFLRLFL